MSKKKLFIYSILFLLLTVPWIGLFKTNITIFGFPLWAIYSLSAGIGYCIIIAILIQKYWKSTMIDSWDSHHE